MSWLGRARSAVVRKLLGVDLTELAATAAEVRGRVDLLATTTGQLSGQLDGVDRRLSGAEREWELEIEARRFDQDGTEAAAAALSAIRETAEYEQVFAEREPLVTVRIASYQKTEELIDVAIESVRSQTYEHWEIVVVNDGPSVRTRAAIESLGDRRIRYEELPVRSSYPADQWARWLVAGVPGVNRASQLAAGAWLAPLDDDDAFTPDHIATLLRVAQEHRAEFAHGALVRRNTVSGDEYVLFADPPSPGQISNQALLYLTRLATIFPYDAECWRLREPADWNLIRRMLAAGVRTAGTPEVVGTLNWTPWDLKPPGVH